MIGNPAAPNLNKLAREYGLATDYYGVTHPSEPNYVALLGGSTFGVTNDNPYYLNRVNKPSLVSQLDRAHIGWKAYLQGLPHRGYQGICYPAFCNGTPDKDPLYVSKHNPITNFTTSWNRHDWSRQVPADQLSGDLHAGKFPAFSLIVPDECHDQHGDPPYCVDSGTPGDPQDQHLVATGDRSLGRTVAEITRSPMWRHGNNAVVVVYDEGDDNAGVSPGAPGAGKVATVVVTSHGPRHLQDGTGYNHYSLLKSIQQNFGLGCLANTCDAKVAPMNRMFRVTGAAAAATVPQIVPKIATPTPTPAEPVTHTTNHRSSAGWTVQPAPSRGSGDNSLGAISGTNPHNIWTVGNFLPDAKSSNPDAALSLAAHYDGARWTSTPTPNAGTNFTTLFGVAAADRQAWAVGDGLDASYAARSVIEHWNGSRWAMAPAPELSGRRDMLFGVTAPATNSVWAVGQQQSGDGRFATLIEHFDGARWTSVLAPNPGRSGNSLYAVTAASDHDVWAVGQQSGPSGDEPLVLHFNGRRWSTVRTEHVNGLFDAVTSRNGQVWAAGQTDDAASAGRPLIENLTASRTKPETWRTSGVTFSNLNGIAVDRTGTVWASGTVFDPHGTYDGSPGGVQQTLILRRDKTGWVRVDAPSPGTADRVLGQLSSVGGRLTSVGYFKAPGGRQPLIETHQVP